MTALTYSVEEAAARIGGITPDWLKRRLNRQELPGTRFGRSWRLTEEDIQAVLAMHHQEVVVPANPWGLTATSQRRVAS